MKKLSFAGLFLLALGLQHAGSGQTRVVNPEAEKAPYWFNTLVAHWTDYADPDYLKFLEEARPGVAQVGFYGCTFWSLAHTPAYSGYPAHMPVQGLKACGDWFERLNGEIHRRNVKVIGHFNIKFLFGDPAKNTGFFEFYNKLWDEKELGPRPVKEPLSMMQRDAAGKPVISNSYNIGGWPEYHACLNNPYWRAVLKVMVRQAVRRGVDGLVINYFYRHDCMCHYCVADFRRWLAEQFTPDQLRDKFGITDLRYHKFTEIPSWHDPATTTPYKMAAITWTQIAWKKAFDEVFIDYGRKIKPGLIVGQWNHLGDFGQIAGDERSALPAQYWGTGEDYLWYSTGGAAAQTDLAKRVLGEGTLQLRYIRGAFGPKPFLLGKYESTRTRVSIAEGVANDGAGMGFYAPFKDPAGREALNTYFNFLHQRRNLYETQEPAAPLLLLYPRSAVHQGRVGPVDRFRRLGRHLLHAGYAFDVLPDDLLTAERLQRFSAVALVEQEALSAPARAAVQDFAGATLRWTEGEELPATVFQETKLTRRDGFWTVLISQLAQPAENRVLLHLVNYNREEPPAGVSPQGRGPQDEKPLRVENQRVHLVLPAGRQVASIQLISPDEGVEGGAKPLAFEAEPGGVTFVVPSVLVYAVAVVQLQP